MTTLKVAWRNTEIAGLYDAGVIRQFKERVPGRVYVRRIALPTLGHAEMSAFS